MTHPRPAPRVGECAELAAMRSSPEKQERRREILDAAEQLLIKQVDSNINMAAVAIGAGVAKGTLYLYFPSKEELLLALHARHVEDFFDALDHCLEAQTPVDSADILAVIKLKIVDHSTYLTLVNRCVDMMGRGIAVQASFTFKQRIATRIQHSGSLIEQRFVIRQPSDGVALLMHTHALVIGLWQMLRPLPAMQAIYQENRFTFFERDYFAELSMSFSSLWAGAASARLE